VQFLVHPRRTRPPARWSAGQGVIRQLRGFCHGADGAARRYPLRPCECSAPAASFTDSGLGHAQPAGFFQSRLRSAMPPDQSFTSMSESDSWGAGRGAGVFVRYGPLQITAERYGGGDGTVTMATAGGKVPAGLNKQHAQLEWTDRDWNLSPPPRGGRATFTLTRAVHTCRNLASHHSPKSTYARSHSGHSDVAAAGWPALRSLTPHRYAQRAWRLDQVHMCLEFNSPSVVTVGQDIILAIIKKATRPTPRRARSITHSFRLPAGATALNGCRMTSKGPDIFTRAPMALRWCGRARRAGGHARYCFSSSNCRYGPINWHSSRDE